jgi:hypothetical protein
MVAEGGDTVAASKFVEQSVYSIAIVKSILAGVLVDVEEVHLTIIVNDV